MSEGSTEALYTLKSLFRLSSGGEGSLRSDVHRAPVCY
jgi:hypothetical protein